MTSIELDQERSFDVLGGKLTIAPPTNAAFAGSNGSAGIDVDGWRSCTSIEVGWTNAICCLIGLEDDALVVLEATPPAFRVVGALHRLDFEGGYDPGGFERVAFHHLTDGGMLIEYECGLARVVPGKGVRWDRHHDDVTARVIEVKGHQVWLQSENGRLGFDLDHGAPIWT